MTRILFHHADGSGTSTADSAAFGAAVTLLDIAQAIGQPLEGTCEGQMACSTCHVIVDAADFARLPRASEAEEDMLDLAAGACRTSRLACQIALADAGGTLAVTIPGDFRNMQGL